MRYAAIVLYFRRGPAICETVRAISELEPAPDELILVDNSSNDSVIEDLARAGMFPDGLRTVILDENCGYAKAMNLGVTQLRSEALDYVLFVTHEVVCTPETMRELAQVADRNRPAVLGPALRLPDGSVWSFGGGFNRRGGTFHLSSPSATPPRWLDGSFLMVRKDAFDQIAGFDDDYFLYWEDVDLCARLAEYGEVVCVTSVSAEQSTQSTPVYFHTRNRLIFWRKRQNWLRLTLSAMDLILLALRRDLRYQNRSNRLVARALGIYDAITERPARLMLDPREGS